MYGAPVSMNILGLLFRVHCNHGVISRNEIKRDYLDKNADGYKIKNFYKDNRHMMYKN